MQEKRTAGDRVRKYIDLTIEDRSVQMLLRAATADISANGMRLVTSGQLAKGSSYTFTLKRPPHLVVHGEVRWVEQLGSDTFRAGVHFVHNAAETDTTLGAFVEAELNTRAAPSRPRP